MSDSERARTEQLRQRRSLTAFRPTAKEIGALVCAALPFVVFIGSTNRVVVNGQVVRNESFNVVGLLLAVIAIGLVASSMRTLNSKFLRGPPALHGAILVLAGVIAIYQLLKAISLI